jgi:hypothetical protein
MNEQIAAMKRWCADNYSNGADTMIECWDDSNYASLWDAGATDEQAWKTLRDVASVYADRIADGKNSAF